MQLGEFVKNVVSQVVDAAEESSNKLNRQIYVAKPQDNNSIQFDVAVTVETTNTDSTNAGITVLGIGLTADGSNESKNSQVSRVKFGIYVSTQTKEQDDSNRKLLTDRKH